MPQIIVKIGGVDVTEKTIFRSTVISSKVSKQMSVAHVEVIDLDEATSISERDEIIISNVGDTIRYFAGEVANLQIDTELGELGGDIKVFKLDCQDYTCKADSRRVKAIYESKTEKEILEDVFGTYLPEFDASTYVDTGDTLTYVTFDNSSIRQILDELCKASGRSWYIDYWKNLHYFNASTAPSAPFGLSSSPVPPTTYRYQLIEYASDATQIRNKVKIKGVEKIYPITEWYYGNGNANNPSGGLDGLNGSKMVFIMPFKYLPEDDLNNYFYIALNTGSDEPHPDGTWHSTIPGIEGVDQLQKDGGIYEVLWNADEKRLTFDVAPANLGYSIFIRARYTIPIEVEDEDPTSIGLYGTWEDLIDDVTIMSEYMAELVAAVFLAENAYPRLTLKVRCWQDGLDSGMLVPVYEALRGVDDNFVIQEMTIRFILPDAAEYELALGVYRHDTIDILMSLQDKIAGASGKVGGITSGRSVDITVNLPSDHSFSGIYTDSIAGEVLTFGALIQYDATSEKWFKTDGDAEETTEGWIGICLTDADADAPIRILLFGTARDDSWAWTGAHGHTPLYVSGTVGVMTMTSGACKYVRRIAIAITPDIIWFTGEMALVETL